jgi:hypothetical protein
VGWRLAAQLRDPLAALAGAWPQWCDRLLLLPPQSETTAAGDGGVEPALFLPLLPLGPRLALLRLAALGPARTLHAVQEGARRLQGENDGTED